MIKNNEKIVKYIIIVIGVLLFIIGAIYDYAFPNFIAIYIMIISIFICFLTRKNSLLLILSLFTLYFNYSICFSNYIHVVEGTMFTKLANTDVSAYGIYIMFLFWLVILAFLNTSFTVFNNSSETNCLISENNSNINRYIVYIINVLLVYIFITGFIRPENIGDRGSPTPLYEYSTIFFIISYYYGNNNKDCKCITTIMLFLFAGQNFVFGGRVTGLQLVSIFYLFCLSHKIKFSKMIPWLIVAFIVLTIIGEYRGAWLYNQISFKDVWDELANKRFTLDTAYSSYYTSLTFIMVEKFASINQRFVFFLHFLIQIIMGGRSLGDYDLTAYSHRYYVHYYGGILPYYFHFYLGWMGVVFIALFVVFLINTTAGLTENDKGIKKCILTYFVCTVPRWYLYSPSQITRGFLLLALVYYSISIINSLGSRGKISIDL